MKIYYIDYINNGDKGIYSTQRSNRLEMMKNE